MSSLVIVFQKIEDAKKIRGILIKHGFTVDAVCTTAAQALGEMNNLGGGVLLCGYRLPDMFFADLRECMPDSFEMILIASSRMLDSCEDSLVVSLAMPLSVQELVSTVRSMQQIHSRNRKKRKKPEARSPEEQKVIDTAKELLMQRNRMTEVEAHKYLQKCSMDSGNNLIETAQMVLALMNC